MKAVANLRVEFAWVQVVCSAERKTIVEKNATVGDVDAVNIHGKAFAKTFAEREVEGCVSRQMCGSTRYGASVREARGVVHVRGSIGAPWKAVLSAEVQRVALVVVEELKAIAKREIGEAAVDVAESKGELIRVGQVELAAIADARRAQGELPPVNARALNRDGKENVGVIQIVVIEEVAGARQEIVGVKGPASKRDSDPKLVLFVPFTVKRDEIKGLSSDELQEGTGCGDKWRRLIEMAVEAAKDPLQFRDSDGSTDARAGRIFNHSTGKVGLANTRIQGKPGCRL